MSLMLTSICHLTPSLVGVSYGCGWRLVFVEEAELE